MKKTFLMLSLAVPVLSGCAGLRSGSPQGPHDHSQQAAAAQPGHGLNQQAGMMGMMDMKAMCDMRHMMSGMPMAEREAMMDKRMPGMTPEQRQQRMRMMDEQCK